ncbi:MAG: aminodeoxychorismate synthase component I [Saprospirales bacterium]|nr:aminodeoxychorismate synthase component I [Saprospirales bacterium]
MEAWKRAAFHWASSFSPVCYLDSNQHSVHPGTYECLIGAGSVRQLNLPQAKGAFSEWKTFWKAHPTWLFGHLSYDLKNDVETLESRHFDGIGFPLLYFFEPLYILELFPDGTLHIRSQAEAPELIYEAIEKQVHPPEPTHPFPEALQIQARMNATEYKEKILHLKEHILEGDIYEANFCQEFFAENCTLHPAALFSRLNQLARAPFSAYYQVANHFLLCASPERFLKKEGRLLTSQPIKGTIRRGRDAEEDQAFRTQLFYSEKDRAENVMIVDLVRNDLARSCVPGSVQVPELFGIYPFAQVFQMISTVQGELREEVSFVDAIRQAFPMGSMTGAPKVKAMELIEEYEQSRRGLYSGAVGYITPEGDFDFNVVIRSLLYNQARRYLSFQVGGAIVYDSVPEQEYEECGWKARALLTVLGQKD